MHFFSQIALLRIDDRARSGIEQRLHLVRLPCFGDRSRADSVRYLNGGKSYAACRGRDENNVSMFH